MSLIACGKDVGILKNCAIVTEQLSPLVDEIYDPNYSLLLMLSSVQNSIWQFTSIKNDNFSVISISQGYNWSKNNESYQLTQEIKQKISKSAENFSVIYDQLKKNDVILFSAAGNDSNITYKQSSSYSSLWNFYGNNKVRNGEFYIVTVTAHDENNKTLPNSNHEATLSCPSPVVVDRSITNETYDQLMEQNVENKRISRATSFATPVCAAGFNLLLKSMNDVRQAKEKDKISAHELMKCLMSNYNSNVGHPAYFNVSEGSGKCWNN